jgi:glutamate-1-semialdehyde 2,1-aminomutase
MTAIKAARAYTGRPKIAKFEGAYHGSYDHVEVSLDPNPSNRGPADAPAAIAYAAGTSPRVLQDTIVLPFDDPDAAAALIATHAGELAAVLIDPVPSRVGIVATTPALLEQVRAVTAKHGVLMISDEIVSFRIGWSGAHSAFGYTPDMVVLGKVIGGGQPFGAIAGRTEVMAVFDSRNGQPRLAAGGTFTANPVTMAAGLASMTQPTPEAYKRLDALGDRVRAGLTGVGGHATSLDGVLDGTDGLRQLDNTGGAGTPLSWADQEGLCWKYAPGNLNN